MAEYIEREDMANAKPTEYKKIKAFNPQIVVEGTADKPYYNISYYDTERKEWVIGYGSYKLEYVQKWLEECFEKVEADVAEVRHGEWIDKGQEDDSYENCYECSACHNWIFMVDEEYNYCPNCGAKMDKEREQE